MNAASGFKRSKELKYKFYIDIALEKLNNSLAFTTTWNWVPQVSTVMTWLKTFLNQGYISKDGRGLATGPSLIHDEDFQRVIKAELKNCKVVTVDIATRVINKVVLDRLVHDTRDLPQDEKEGKKCYHVPCSLSTI